MPMYTDQTGHIISLDKTSQRIVSLVPSQTELLYALGLDEEVVGITKFCVHPEHWFRSKTRVGGTKNVDIGKVKQLQPDLIIANREENVKEQAEALAAIAPVWTSDIRRLEDAFSMIRSMGELTGTQEKTASVLRQLQADFDAIATEKAGAPKPRTAYLIWREPWMAAGGDTFISDLLERAGFCNAFADLARYPEISGEDIMQRRTELILLSSEPYPFREKHIAELSALAPGVPVKLVNGEMFSWYGSRLLKFREYLTRFDREP